MQRDAVPDTTATPIPDADQYLGTWTSARSEWFVRPNGHRLRFIRTGDGPPLVLLHTVRTQLDYFQRLIPMLKDTYTVYAVDFPGMGWSDISPGERYDHEDLTRAVIEFVNGRHLEDVTLVGESMGAAIALTASIHLESRVRRVVASNPYDYEPGLARANPLARTIIGAVRAPVLGAVFAPLENKRILRAIMRGGYAHPLRLPEPFLNELTRAGARPGYPKVARAVYRNLPSLVAAKAWYSAVTVPVDLVYSDQDWSLQADRDSTAARLPDATVHAFNRTGHFAAMEHPDQFAAVILGR